MLAKRMVRSIFRERRSAGGKLDPWGMRRLSVFIPARISVLAGRLGRLRRITRRLPVKSDCFGITDNRGSTITRLKATMGGLMRFRLAFCKSNFVTSRNGIDSGEKPQHAIANFWKAFGQA